MSEMRKPAKRPGAKRPAGAKRAGGNSPNAFVALLRGVNVGGNKLVPMRELCGLATELGFEGVRSYVQSGNLVFRAPLAASEVEARLEAAIARRFGFAVEVVVRSAAEWAAYAAKSPFQDAADERPQLLHLALSKKTPAAGAVKALGPYAKAGERIELARGGLWIDFRSGAGRSKLTPAVLDRLVGSTVTARNFRTVQKLAELLLELAPPAKP
jgi:uncharacterized protein (DUF1697 family)